LWEVYLLLGIALGIVSLIRIFSSAVDGTRPRYSILFLFAGVGMAYYGSVISGKELTIIDVKNALFHLFAQLFG
jgi:uncharacterized membrane protein